MIVLSVFGFSLFYWYFSFCLRLSINIGAGLLIQIRSDPFDRGCIDFENGVPFNKNPFHMPPTMKRWREGWCYAFSTKFEKQIFERKKIRYMENIKNAKN